MSKFEVRVLNNIIFNGTDSEYLTFILDEDFYNYGSAVIDIKVEGYSVKNVIWIYIGDFKLLYKNLEEMYTSMKGNTYFCNPDETLEITFSFNKRGYVIINGRYKEQANKINELKFEFECTQPQLYEAIYSIKMIISND